MNLLDRAKGIEQAQRALEANYPATVSIAGQSYLCAAMPKPTSLDTDPLGGGFVEILPLVIRIRKALLAADGVQLIERETRIDFRGQEFRLLNIGGREEADCAWHLTLATPSKG